MAVTVLLWMPTGASHAVRGAVAGAVAAGIWALQQPLDRKVFGVAHDDTELLGKLVTRGPAWPAAGAALHVLNGAAFGAIYAQAAPRLPLPAWARGPAVGLAEHVATWPLTVLTDRRHPARGDLPALASSPRAFAQSLWRHVLFGAVLGELERRLNRPEQPAPSPEALALSSDGHGRIEHTAGTA
jgi:hypothetical protein